MRLRGLRWSAACLCLVVVACGDDGPTGPRPPVLSVVSGDAQPGRAGRQLGQPFVVRVTDHRGRGVEGVAVTWTITPGEGVFGDGTSLTFEGVFDDDFERLDEGSCLISALQTVRHTDSDGIAQVRFMPTWFGPVTVTARAAGVSDPVTFTTDASDPGAVLTIVAGNHHVGKAGEMHEDAPGLWKGQRFEARVTNGQGEPVPHVAVRWVITSGDVALAHGCGAAGLIYPPATWARTRSDGITHADFRLVVVGTSTVAVAVPGVLVSPVTFTVTATAAVIMLWDYWGGGGSFLAPDFSSDATVPVGAPVEWVNVFESARIVSTSAPPGGASFDSGELGANDRFEFVPAVAGTWEYVDQVSGATGTLTAQ